MAIVQPQWYSEADFERVEQQAARWRSIRESEGWPDFAAAVEGMLYGWTRSMETLDPKEHAKVQGMLTGARAVLALVAGKLQEKEEIIAGMHEENDRFSDARTDQEGDEE